MKFVGDTIHFTLDAGETGGTATVDVGEVHTRISLYDDGTRGDAAPHDGVYELDYVTIASDVVRAAPIVGHFTSAAGQNAPPVQSVGGVTVADWASGESSVAPVASIETDLEHDIRFAENRLIVTFVEAVSFEQVQALLATHNLTLASWLPALMVFEIELTETQEYETLQQLLLNEPEVDEVGRNIALDLFGIQNEIPDTRIPVGQSNYFNPIRAKLGWGTSKGSSAVKVAIIDTGADLDHPELAGQIEAYFSCLVCGIGDADGHGTFISGIVAAENGTKGLSGIAPNVDLLIFNIGFDNIFQMSVALDIKDATDNGATVINMSWGTSGVLGNPGTLRNAIKYAYDRDVVLIAATGNDGKEIIKADSGVGGTRVYPASYTRVLAVGATDKYDAKRADSNYGDEVIYAPATNISSISNDGGYATGSQTSFAAPQVAALAALIQSVKPGVGNWEVVSIIKQTADTRKTQTGSSMPGLGRINVYRALQKAKTGVDPGFNDLPLAPTDLGYSLGKDDSGVYVRLRWLPPDKDYAGVQIYRFEVDSGDPYPFGEAIKVEQLTGSPILDSGGTGYSFYDDRTLGTDKTYKYYVFSVDQPPFQESIDYERTLDILIDPNNVPNTPSSPSIADGAINQSLEIGLNWALDNPDGTKVTYDVYFEANDNSPDIPICQSVNSPTCTPAPLSDSTHYYWQVIAKDEYGTTIAGPKWSFTTSRPPSSLSTPSPSDEATDQNVDVVLSWPGGDPDGDPVSYAVYFEANDATPDNLICYDIATPSCDPGPLANNTRYFWYVIATDDRGASRTGSVWQFTTGGATSTVTMDQALTFDYWEVSKSTFRPGEAITLGLLATNHSDETTPVTYYWKTYDPNGAQVSYLSWDGFAVSMPPGEDEWSLWRGVPANAPLGTYTFEASVVDFSGSSTASTSFLVQSIPIPITLLDALTCKDVQNDTDPIDVADVFSTDDGRVYAWTAWEGASGLHTVDWRWYRPDGTLFGDFTYDYDTMDSLMYVWSWAYIGESGSSQGQWHVDFSMDGSPAGTLYFTLNAGTGTQIRDVLPPAMQGAVGVGSSKSLTLHPASASGEFRNR